jgi:nucleoside-diphosphate-sugar epimerase
MANCVVTGAAGFIGSHLCEALINTGHTVTGIDSFCPTYSIRQKQANVRQLLLRPRFKLVNADLAEIDLTRYLKSADWVFHQAAQPGVRPSWGSDFTLYLDANLMATKNLLEACVHSGVSRLVYASSSSVYGAAHSGAVHETDRTEPVSPYAVTKLAGEQLCHCYEHTFGLNTIVLRYFTVYGPRQRPDMAFSRFFDCVTNQRPMTIFGDGTQSRDFTFVLDVVRANLALIEKGISKGTFNIASGRSTCLLDVIEVMRSLASGTTQIRFLSKAAGDPEHTLADISEAHSVLGYGPVWDLEDGLRAQWSWLKESRNLLETPQTSGYASPMQEAGITNSSLNS